MTSEDHDPLLDKLHALPVHKVDSARGAQTLRLAEESLRKKVRPGIAWPKFAMSVALTMAGAMYTVDSVNKLGNIYVSNQVAALDIER